MAAQPMILPRYLNPGDTIGVFTPSSPAYGANPGLFENGVKNLERLGFKVKLGRLTAARVSEGYRSASGEERAREFMELIHDSEVRGLISTIGGFNSNSMIPYLDFEAIARSRKVICGYSDVTSLHLAILKLARLRTFYGPAVMTWFGDWPNGDEQSTRWWLDAVMKHREGSRRVEMPSRWSNFRRRWDNGDWKNLPREWTPNEPGWKALSPGKVEAPIVAANLNTLMSTAGTSYWPDLEGKILLIEEADAPLMREERSLRQLELIGGFDQIAGLIFSKPEVYDAQGAPFDLEDLLREVVDKRSYPIVTGFDCGHTLPMLTVPQEAKVRLEARQGSVSFEFLEPACE